MHMRAFSRFNKFVRLKCVGSEGVIFLVLENFAAPKLHQNTGEALIPQKRPEPQNPRRRISPVMPFASILVDRYSDTLTPGLHTLSYHSSLRGWAAKPILFFFFFLGGGGVRVLGASCLLLPLLWL